MSHIITLSKISTFSSLPLQGYESIQSGASSSALAEVGDGVSTTSALLIAAVTILCGVVIVLVGPRAVEPVRTVS